MFRFQTGSIKSSRSTAPRLRTIRGFDSKLVRLKDARPAQVAMHYFVFRFQTGSIKSLTACDDNLYRILFRFQTGSIKSGRFSKPFSNSITSFDSKLVRLKVE